MLKDIDITKNIKIIEWLKSEILSGVARLFAAFSSSGKDVEKEESSSCIANIIIVSYLLAKRLGIDFEDINSDIKAKLKIGIDENHEIEKRYGDLSSLLRYIKGESER